MAMQQDKTTNTTKSFESSCHKLKTDAPTTFLIHISFVRCSAVKEARPNKPRQEISMARIAKKPANLPMRSSTANCWAYASSANWYSNGPEGFILLKTPLIFDNASDTEAVGAIRTKILFTHPYSR